MLTNKKYLWIGLAVLALLGLFMLMRCKCRQKREVWKSTVSDVKDNYDPAEVDAISNKKD